MPYRALTHGRVKRHIKNKKETDVDGDGVISPGEGLDNKSQQRVSNSSKGLENSGSVISKRNRLPIDKTGLSPAIFKATPKVEIKKKDGTLATMIDFKKKNSQGKGKRALANPMPSVGGMSRFAKRAIQKRTNLSTTSCCDSKKIN